MAVKFKSEQQPNAENLAEKIKHQTDLSARLGQHEKSLRNIMEKMSQQVVLETARQRGYDQGANLQVCI